ncbi:MAG: LuxR C-terminal-related transcriptional regulator [Phycisphaeraceae bacterium]
MAEVCGRGPILEKVATVYVISDDPQAARSHLSTLADAGLTAAAVDLADQLPAQSDRTQPACAVIDWNGRDSLRLPPLHAPCFQQGLPIIVLHSQADVDTAVTAMRQGAWDFIAKPVSVEQLLARVRQALEHDQQTGSSRHLCQLTRQRLAMLTPRESQVMRLVVAGKANKQIADELDVSIKTVEVHRANVMRKMEADSLAQLVHQAIRIGIDGEGI